MPLGAQIGGFGLYGQLVTQGAILVKTNFIDCYIKSEEISPLVFWLSGLYIALL
jgi:hypothetical protein